MRSCSLAETAAVCPKSRAPNSWQIVDLRRLELSMNAGIWTKPAMRPLQNSVYNYCTLQRHAASAIFAFVGKQSCSLLSRTEYKPIYIERGLLGLLFCEHCAQSGKASLDCLIVGGT